jgi:hypothetical protein
MQGIGWVQTGLLSAGRISRKKVSLSAPQLTLYPRRVANSLTGINLLQPGKELVLRGNERNGRMRLGRNFSYLKPNVLRKSWRNWRELARD